MSKLTTGIKPGFIQMMNTKNRGEPNCENDFVHLAILSLDEKMKKFVENSPLLSNGVEIISHTNFP